MFRVDVKLSEASRKLIRKMPDVVVPALYKGMKQAVLLAERTVKSPYLSGKALNRRTGRLRNSITNRVTIQGNRVVGSVGTNVVYGRIHELGYSGPMSVKAHSRMIRQAFGRPLQKPRLVEVRAHTRQVSMRPRPFLRPAIQDNLTQIGRLLSVRIEEAFG